MIHFQISQGDRQKVCDNCNDFYILRKLILDISRCVISVLYIATVYYSTIVFPMSDFGLPFQKCCPNLDSLLEMSNFRAVHRIKFDLLISMCDCCFAYCDMTHQSDSEILC